MQPPELRILDANFNRAREALRVLEEHTRMVLNDEALTRRVKQLRHDLASAMSGFGPAQLLSARQVQEDVGTGIATATESARADTTAVAVAAAKRAAESLRCMEEYGKIGDPAAAARIEQLRYAIYHLEQDIFIGGPRHARLRAASLHVLVTESLCRLPWLDVCAAALAGGADVIQLREKQIEDRELLDRARRILELTARHGALLIINDRPDIARIAGADGVHVGQADLPVRAARSIIGHQCLVGASTHGEVEARLALAERPDYLGVGTMFASPTKPDVPVQGPGLLDKVMGMTDLPVVAIGGITAENVIQLPPRRWNEPRAESLPSRCVAVSSAIIASADPAAAARAIKSHLTRKG